MKAILALLALAGQTTAPPPRPCLPVAEAEALMTVLLPDVVSAVGQRCARALPATATLRGGLAPMLLRWRGERAAALPQALGAVTKIVGGPVRAADAQAMLDMVGSTLIDGMAPTMPAATCAKVDRAVTLAGSLPARNLAALAVMAAQLGGRASRGLTICPAPIQ